jgi:hypothetical protein
MLEIRPNCELCNCDLPPDSEQARICSYECTFCASCVDSPLDNVCPNCGGGFVARPIRPASEHRVHGTDAPGQSVSIKAGSLDNTRDLQPSAHIWLQSAQPWLAIDREQFLCFESELEDKAVFASQQPHESDNDRH